MTITIDATVGGASANSYNTEAEMATVAASMLPEPTWVGADEDVQRRAMVTAADLIDREVAPGSRASSTQEREYPRTDIEDGDSTTIPRAVKRAHALTSFFLVAANEAGIDPFADAIADSEAAGLASIDFGGDLKMQFQKTGGVPWDAFLDGVVRPLLARLVEEADDAADAWATAGRSARGPCR